METAEKEGGEVTPANKKRNLEKKLKQIEQLKQRRERGEGLNAEQSAKVDSEGKVRDEIQALAVLLGE